MKITLGMERNLLLEGITDLGAVEIVKSRYFEVTLLDMP